MLELSLGVCLNFRVVWELQANGASQLYAGAGALQSGESDLIKWFRNTCWLYTNIGTGVNTLSSGASAYTSGVSTLSGALSQLNANSEAVNSLQVNLYQEQRP